MEMRIQSQSLYRILQAIGNATEACNEEIDKAAKSNNSDYFESVVDDECAVIENLLGAAFVACQAEITAVVSHAKQIHSITVASGINLAVCDGTKDGILSIGAAMVQGSAYTRVQVINAFANYFKHCEEWGSPWLTLTGQSKATAQIISSMGADESNNTNLRTGTEALGITDYAVLEPLAGYVSDWINAVRKSYETELRQHKLL